MAINTSFQSRLQWKNNRNWLKLKILSLTLQHPREEWISCKNLQREFQENFSEKPSTATLYSALKRYHVYGLVQKRKYQGMQCIYRISDKGARRFLYLVKEYLRPMFLEYQDDPVFFATHASKITQDFTKIWQIFHEFINTTDPARTVLIGDAILGDSWDWGMLKEVATACGMIENEKEKRQCLRDIKRVRKQMVATRKQVQEERESKEERHPLDLRAPINVKEMDL